MESVNFKNMFSLYNIKKFIIVNIGVLILSIALHFFLVPSNLAVGGAAGLAILLASVFKFLSVSGTLLFINIFLIVLGFFTIGKEFGAYTIYASVALSAFLRIFEVFTPMKVPFTDDVFLNLVFGIFIQGIGVGLVLNKGASTGGTDIVAKIVEKYTHFSFGNGLVMSDGIITLGACLVYGPKLGMYALMGVIMNSLIIDKMLAGFDSKYNITIISEKLEDINQIILIDLFRGSTIYVAEGGYSHKTKKILTTIVDRKDYILLREFVKRADSNAFMYISHITEVEGRGFTYEQKKK